MRAAATFFTAVNAAAAGYRARNHISVTEYPDPFPLRALRHARSKEVRGEDGRVPRPILASALGEIMCWRSIWMLFLPCEVPSPTPMATHRRDPVPVYGSTVEAVIGPGGRIESIVSTVRPWTSVRRVTAFNPPHEHEGGTHKEKAADLVYVADGADEPQTFFAPFYLSMEAAREHPHGTVLRPASDYSLIVDMIVLPAGEAARIVPVVMDGEGEMVPVDPRVFKLSWFYGRFEETSVGEVTRSTEQELRIEGIGTFHIELTIEGRATGSVRSTYRHIPLGGRAPSLSMERVV